MRGLSPNWLLGTETLHLYIRRSVKRIWKIGRMYVSNKKARPMVTYTQGYSTLNKGEVYYEQYK